MSKTIYVAVFDDDGSFQIYAHTDKEKAIEWAHQRLLEIFKDDELTREDIDPGDIWFQHGEVCLIRPDRGLYYVVIYETNLEDS